jgi:monoamine oxidase
LGFEKFDQFSTGTLSFEDETGQVQRGRGFSSMEGSLRLKGGLSALMQTLTDGLPEARKRLNAQVTAVTKTDKGITSTLANGDTLAAQQVVFAAPPRIAVEIVFSPALPPNAVASMKNVPTWMAGQAKVVAVYDRAFWRDEGLSGDAMSRFGPMAEIHDASPATGGPYALFGFIGVPPQDRSDEQVLRQQLQKQLTRLFGAEAAEPKQLFVKDWAFDPQTSTDADRKPLSMHPAYGTPRALRGLWDDTLQFAGTEFVPQFGGFIEGALEFAENVLKTLEA